MQKLNYVKGTEPMVITASFTKSYIDGMSYK